MLIFWAVAVAMVMMVVALLVLAMRRDTSDLDATGHDLRVYRDQLGEVDRSAARGDIAPEEAERLRTEVARRILSADKARRDVPALPSGPKGPLVLALVAGAMIATAAAAYVSVGRPGAPDLPLAQRLAEADAQRRSRPSQETVEASLPAAVNVALDPQHAELVKQLRDVVAERPDDILGHQLLARNEAGLGNYAAAWRAQARLVDLRGAAVDPDELALLADLMIRAAGGYVSPQAEQVLMHTLRIDPRHRQARYYAGLMFLQNDRPDQTFHLWSQLWTDSRASDPWAPLLERQLPDIAWLAGQHRYELPPLRGAAPGPDAAAVAAAQDLSPEERAEMVRGMVEGLSARLAAEGGPPEDWARLIGALAVLGEAPRARAILLEAETVFADSPPALETLRRAARTAGVTE